MHASLNLGGQLLLGCDAPPGHYDEPKGYYVQLAIKDYGFMYQHADQDLDGHCWELIWMNPSAVNQPGQE